MKLFGVTDVGCHRKDNQDSFVLRQLDDYTAMLVVCDGMGGYQAGNVASSAAVEAFAAAVEEEFKNGAHDDPEWWEELLLHACERANQQVFDLAQNHIDYQGMGTTLVAALALPGESYVVNVGDSRCYLIENGMIQQVTVDHSLVQLLVDRGEITAEEARVHPKKNLITRALGVERKVDCDLLRVETGSGSLLLLCSDGLSNMLSDRILLQKALEETDVEQLGQSLLKMTLELGAPDNVTVVLAQL